MGIPTTTAARTAVDLGRWVTFRSAIVVMDSALHLGTDAQAITAVLDDCVGWPGVRNADHDLPAPELQVPRRSKTWDIALSDGDGTTSGADRSGSLVVYAVTCTCE